MIPGITASVIGGGGGGGGGADLPGLWGAYGLAKLVPSYGGPAMKVRRSSDNATMDVGFNGGGTDIDTTALLAWSGADSVFVERWYDQKASNDLAQSTTGAQPRIVDAGAYDGAVWFDGTNDRLTSVTNSGTVAAITTAFRAMTRSNTSGVIVEKGPDINTANGFYILGLNNSGTNVLRMGVSAAPSGPSGQFVAWNGAGNVTTEGVFVVRYDRSLSTATSYQAWRRAWKNGTELVVTHVTTNLNPGAAVTFTPNAYNVGNRAAGGQQLPLNLKALAIYEANMDADVATITAAL